MTTIEALQNLYTTLGGEASEVAEINTIPAMLEAINGVAGGGSDAGAVVANFTGIGEISCDKTFDELAEAYKNGQEIIPFYATRITMGPEERDVIKGSYFAVTGSDQTTATSLNFIFIYVYNTAIKFTEIVYTSSGLTKSDTKTITTS